jgi:hypothetical protein
MKRSIITAALVAVALGLWPGTHAQSQQALEAAHQRLLPVFQLAGVVFTDADESTGRVVVGVLNRDIEGLVRAQVQAQGVPLQSVQIVETDAIVPVATLRDKVRPVVAGLQIRYSQYVCSIGFNAWRGTAAGFVTASHCSTKQGSVDGTKYYQPLNQVTSELIGSETVDPGYFRNSSCPRGWRCRHSDSNFNTAAANVNFSLGRIARTTGVNNGSLELMGEFAITGEGTAALNSTVGKVGRSTGWTQGTLTRTCVNTAVSGTAKLLLCQNFVESASQIVVGGDSGSPVFRLNSDGNVTLLGNLWGGNGAGTLFVYSPIANIERELGPLTTF